MDTRPASRTWVPVTLALCLSSLSFPLLAETPEEKQLRFELQQLKLLNERNAQQIQQLEQRLQQLGQPAEAATSNLSPASPPPERQTVRTAPRNQNVESLLQEEHALFTQDWSFEIGLGYTHTNRRQLALNGFLALDAIFLGNISVDDVETDIITLDLAGRYRVNEDFQIGVHAPFLQRVSTYSTSGGNNETVQQEVTRDYAIGDVNLNANLHLLDETDSHPDMVLNLSLRAPTGDDPYGVKILNVGPQGTLQIPEELPTGSGVWALTAGLSFLRTTDPAILFGNLGYTHNFRETFDDISSAQGEVVPGEIKLGDSVQLGGGMAFALNERTSLSTSLSVRFLAESKTQREGQPEQTILGSDATIATFNTGLTYSLDPRTTMVTNIGIGLTDDAPDFSFNIKYPFSL